MTKPITSFRNEYAFLSNFYAVPVDLDDKTYPTLEHAFQAAKTLDDRERFNIYQASTPGRAKRLGRRVTLRQDWNEIRYDIMYDLVYNKFIDHEMMVALLNTGDADIIEGNSWHDNYWGVCMCGRCNTGINQLGNILMDVREELNNVN